MTIRSVGYDGAISEVDWAAYLAPYLGTPPGVAGANDFEVTPGQALSVRVAPGTAHGWGVTDVSDAAETITLTQATSGVRHDCIVLTRDWAATSVTPTGVPTGGRTLIEVVQGGSEATLPQLVVQPGVKTQQPLALVKVTAGTSSPSLAADTRQTHAKAAYARSLLAMTGPPGTRYTLEPTGRRYVMRENSAGVVVAEPEWEPDPPVIPPIPLVDSGTAALDFNDTGAAVITHNLGRRPKTVRFTSRASVSSGMVELYLSIQAGSITSTQFTLVAKVIDSTAASGWKPYTGNLSAVDWLAVG